MSLETKRRVGRGTQDCGCFDHFRYPQLLKYRKLNWQLMLAVFEKNINYMLPSKSNFCPLKIN